MYRKIITIGSVFLLMSSLSYGEDSNINFPSSDHNASLYYQMGGGQSVPISAVDNTGNIPINAEGNIGLGFNCGAFNPVATITNSLNDFENSVQNVPGSVVKNATSAITSFPMFKLAQADPKLYNVLNNNVIGAHNQFALKMKSCETMQSDALKGKNPYNKWISYSRNNNLQQQIFSGTNDLNTAMDKVNKNQGDNGVPWAIPGEELGKSAGGSEQPPIHVIHDTAIAGYNVMLGRNPTAVSPPSPSDDNQNLLNYWGKPSDAAGWVVTVVGDQSIKTCSQSDCGKKSTPGIGLLPDVQKTTKEITQKLSDLVANSTPINRSNLLAVSAPGQVVSEALIDNIRQMNPNAQSNTIATLAQNIATTRIVNEALLALDILEMGSQVPNIHAVDPAQTVIHEKRQLLQDDINHIMYSVNIRRALDSHVMGQIMTYTQNQNTQSAMIPELGNQPAQLTNGGIVKRGQS